MNITEELLKEAKGFLNKYEEMLKEEPNSTYLKIIICGWKRHIADLEKQTLKERT